MTEKQLLKSFDNLISLKYGARFYKADLHFHTPASADARGRNRYDFNPYRVKQSEPGRKEEILADSRKVAAKMVERFLEEKLSVVAITDHNCIGTLWLDIDADGSFMDLTAPTWYELIDDEAQKINQAENKKVLTVLPGVEISNSGIHLLAIFPPQKPRRSAHFIICDLLKETGFAIDDWGNIAATGRTSVYNTIEFIKRRGGIVIPAHIDGSDQALLRLFRLTSSNMRNILMNKNLAAVEIVNPDRIKRIDSKLKRSVKTWMDDFRRKENLNTFAFTQGSDAHDLINIGKRYSLIKMSSPAFEGLSDAFKIPSSRVRLSEDDAPWNGLFIAGVEINNKYFGKKFIRFNRHLNCLCGKKETGKTYFYNLMHSAVNSDLPLEEGSVSLFLEHLDNNQRRFYAFCRSSEKKEIEFFEIDWQSNTARKIDHNDSAYKLIKPKFFIPHRINEISEEPEQFQQFFIKYFGEASESSAKKFNDLFAVPLFLETSKAQILKLNVANGQYCLSFNIDWRMNGNKEKFVDFFSLNNSRKRCALIIILTICTQFGPVNIDAPEEFLDKSDISEYLAPIIKKYKDFKQINLVSANPSLAVNSDPDNYILFEISSRNRSVIDGGFAIDEPRGKSRLIDIFEGSLDSFNHRRHRYKN